MEDDDGLLSLCGEPCSHWSFLIGGVPLLDGLVVSGRGRDDEFFDGLRFQLDGIFWQDMERLLEDCTVDQTDHSHRKHNTAVVRLKMNLLIDVELQKLITYQKE